MPKGSRESFVRWQGRTLQQFGFVNNLLIGLASGFMAFYTQLAFAQHDFTVVELSIVVVAIVGNGISLLSGCYLAWNRLRSFRVTTQVAYDRESVDRDTAEITRLRSTYQTLDRRSWVFLRVQAGFFALGGLGLMVFVVVRLLGGVG